MRNIIRRLFAFAAAALVLASATPAFAQDDPKESDRPTAPSEGCKPTMDEAAIFWLDWAYKITAEQKIEMGGPIVPCIGGGYFMELHSGYPEGDGKPASLNVGPTNSHEIAGWLTWSGLADGHTHVVGNDVSDKDKHTACRNQRPVYVRAPNGQVIKFDPPRWRFIRPGHIPKWCDEQLLQDKGTRTVVR